MHMDVIVMVMTGQQWTTVPHNTHIRSGDENIKLKEIDLTGILASGQFWRLQFPLSEYRGEISEVNFFQACSGVERTVCTDGNCDVHEVVCDGIVDCDDGSDENNCDKEICPSGVAINKAEVCDGTDDCGDNTDEQNCCERQGRLACSNGHCIGSQKMCANTHIPCFGEPKGQYARCDDVEDCWDGSDESCSVSACDNGALFHQLSRCDGRDDCGDNSDEQNCVCYYLRDRGTSYRGRVNRDNSCQFWTSQYPHTHNHTPQAYPRAGLERNYCRNPDGKDRPWCYTNNPLIRWMYCEEVFACDAPPTRCFYALDKGRSYAGQTNRAGDRVCQRWDSQSSHSHPHTPQRVCKRWDSQYPHSHPHTPQAHPDAGLEENFCRNPDNKERPWCYTMDASKRWDFCDVMECADPPSPDSADQDCHGAYTCEFSSKRLCYCDKDCGFFGDCCEDFQEGSKSQTPSDHHHLKWDCVPGFSRGFTRENENKESYWMVADCPGEWTDDVTRDKCLRQVDPFNPSELVYRMPVEDTSNVPYRNIFCAICNNVSLTETILWMSKVECTGMLALSPQIPRGSQEYNSIIEASWEYCFGTKTIVFVPLNISHARRCVQANILEESCDISSCMSYSYPIGTGYKIYKNFHCALCEGLSLTAAAKLKCASALDPFVRNQCTNPTACPSRFSLTNLFNFNSYGSGGNSPNQCPSDTLYDPFADSCRLFSSTRRTHGSLNNTTPLQNCSKPALTFTAEEFRVLPNGSVHLLGSNVSCPAEQVAILNTTASICGECILQYFSNYTQTANPWDADQGWLTLGLVIVSAVAVFGFVVHNIRSGRWEKVPEKLKVQMLVCMALAEVLFVVRVRVPLGPACTAFAILLHYFLLTAFTSMNALAMDLFLTFRDALERKKLYQYLLYTWLMPMPIVVVTLIVEFGSSVRVGYGENCWIGDPISSLVAFGVPVLSALLVNAVLITFVLLALRKSFEIADKAKSRSHISKAWVYLRICFLTGFTWILGFIYPYVNSRAVEYIFIVLNSSQGLLLTLILTITSKVVQKWKVAIRARFGLTQPKQNAGVTNTANNNQTTATACKTSSSADIPMTTIADVEENRKRTQLDRPHQGRGCTAIVTNLTTTACGTDFAIEMPKTTLADVENTARSHLDKPQQDGATATASTKLTPAGETGVMVPATNVTPLPATNVTPLPATNVTPLPATNVTQWGKTVETAKQNLSVTREGVVQSLLQL
ncbi:uncharacterized protein LOC118405426 [Branchiostoma floridae]|uniref:Uncharacterized protein LOC118405426 n=1 Tax=Branchiostoma floridae TaxID=7739 RepID=A0A9J7KIX6_BRAFL|nr:uncharacterized protein LOC118405426 [Branchiostoma floridae]